MSVLNENIIQNALQNKFSVEIVDSVDSSLDYIRKYIDQNKFDHIVVSKEETKARGRNGKEFACPKDKGIYMSILLKPEITAKEVLKISTLVSTAIYSAVKDLYNINLALKWVNDLILEDKKVGGILCETSINADSSVDYALIGIGLNVHKATYSDELSDIADSLENLANIKVDRNELIIKIVKYIDKYLEKDSNYLEIYKKASYVLGKEIEVYTNNEKFSAVAISVNKYGHLLLDKSGEMIPLISGEVSIRRKL